MTGIVFVHYRIPERRLKEHFEWNLAEYRKRGCKVYVVTDKEYEVPDVAECLVYPDAMPIFSLAKTKNYGIRKAIADGCDPIAVIDVDVCFTVDAFNQCESTTRDQLVMPICLMTKSRETCEEQFTIDAGMGCCIAARAEHWRVVQYDERMEGYGFDDGQIRNDMRRRGLRPIRNTVVFHIAHDPNCEQVNVPGRGRDDCWNRDNGFNPENAEHNKRIYLCR